MATDFLADGEAGDSFTPIQLFAGDAGIKTEPGTVVSGQNLAANAVMGRIAASGKWKVWNPAGSDGSQFAAGILMHATDATSADKGCEVYIAGTFNRDLIVWPGGTTAAQKAYAFDGSKLASRSLGYSM